MTRMYQEPSYPAVPLKLVLVRSFPYASSGSSGGVSLTHLISGSFSEVFLLHT